MRILRCLLIGIAGALLFTSVCQAADPRNEAILKDWRDRRKGIDTVRYVLQGTHVVPRGSISDEDDSPDNSRETPAEDIRHKVGGQFAFDFETGRFRITQDGSVASLDGGVLQWRPSWRECLFDGGDLYIYRPAKRNGLQADHVMINPESGLTNTINQELLVLLLAHGVFAFGEDLKPANVLRSETGPDDLSVVGSESIQGRSVTVLRYVQSNVTDVEYRISVDPERQSAVVNLVMLKNGHKFIETAVEIDRFEGRWMPKLLKKTGYSFNGGFDPTQKPTVEIVERSEWEITERELNEKMPLRDFQLPGRKWRVAPGRETANSRR